MHNIVIVFLVFLFVCFFFFWGGGGGGGQRQSMNFRNKNNLEMSGKSIRKTMSNKYQMKKYIAH